MAMQIDFTLPNKVAVITGELQELGYLLRKCLLRKEQKLRY